MFKHSINNRRISTAIILAVLATVTLVAAIDFDMRNDSPYAVPATLHCECGYYYEVTVLPGTTETLPLPSPVSYIVINNQTVYPGDYTTVSLASGDDVTVDFRGIDDDVFFE